MKQADSICNTYINIKITFLIHTRYAVLWAAVEFEAAIPDLFQSRNTCRTEFGSVMPIFPIRIYNG